MQVISHWISRIGI